jgi:hypothetical protein
MCSNLSDKTPSIGHSKKHRPVIFRASSNVPISIALNCPGIMRSSLLANAKMKDRRWSACMAGEVWNDQTRKPMKGEKIYLVDCLSPKEERRLESKQRQNIEAWEPFLRKRLEAQSVEKRIKCLIDRGIVKEKDIART